MFFMATYHVLLSESLVAMLASLPSFCRFILYFCVILLPDEMLFVLHNIHLSVMKYQTVNFVY